MGDLPDKERAFFEWYIEVLERSGITDKRYPIKGMNVWTPFGKKASSLMDRLIRSKIEPLGYDEVNFPALIPETEFKKEGEHIKGFDEQVYWVTHGGKTELDIKLALRPTSETAMYPMFALWVRSHRDLPLRVYQIVNVFRYETKTTRPFIRVREIHFFEGHTVHLGAVEAEKQVREDIDSFVAITRALCLPHLSIRRPDWDKFPGARYSIAFDMPLGGSKTLQIATVHYYADNFARAYGIAFEDRDGTQKIPHQTTYGISERLLGAVVGMHGDAKGLVFPSSIAPVQIVVIPIPGAGDSPELTSATEVVMNSLKELGIRAVLDASDERPGSKFYRWELKGVPLRVEIGRREIAEKRVTAVNRLGTKTPLLLVGLGEGILTALSAFDSALAARAEASLRSRMVQVTDGGALNPEVVNVIGWCGRAECGHEVEKTPGLSLLGTVEDSEHLGKLPPPVCHFCKNPTNAVWAVAARPL